MSLPSTPLKAGVGAPGNALGSASAISIPTNISTGLGPDTGQSNQDRAASLNGEVDAINELKEMELLPMLLDLIENLKVGKISPKDFDNVASRIRVRINRCKALVNQIEGLSESPEVGIEKVADLKRRMGKKRAVLCQFRDQAKDMYN